ncbi:radial spoke head protein 9 homolog [Halyomorpha halys]|uniref:radial spoke head protein 9 homolog n=1 Tax=Halyomorpha halys TaxID=286706 RepID=UPI0006D4C6B6|nr:radial spoke head protein 9 homolog [Halyomorpha halys]
MELEQLPRCLDLYASSGFTLNQEKCNLLMNSLVVLQNENHFKKVFFWGQIYGIQDDYYIAYGYDKDALRSRVFYYSRNAITWVLVPTLKPKERKHYLAHISSNRFFGNPSTVVEVLDEKPSEETIKEKKKVVDEGEEQEEMTDEQIDSLRAMEIVEEYKLKEEDRLAALIRFINQEAMVVPRGALFKQTNGRVVPNPGFKGLRLEEATILSNYMHCRIPRERWEINVGRRPDYNYATDFLDTIAEDIPKNHAWSVQVCQGNRIVVLRSLYWHGLTFYHLLNTKIYGCLYMGFGEKNIDIPFMI